MTKDQAKLRIICVNSVIAGKPFRIRVEFDFLRPTRIISLIGAVEGHYRLPKDSNSALIVALHLNFNEIIHHWRNRSGILYAHAGTYAYESTVNVSENCPGTLITSSGIIDYAIAVKLQIASRSENVEKVTRNRINVTPVLHISHYFAFQAPIRIRKRYHKAFLCCSTLNAHTCVGLDKAAYIEGARLFSDAFPGEQIHIFGEINNQHRSISIWTGVVELVGVLRFQCKGSQRYVKSIVTCFTIPPVPPCSTVTFKNILQIPSQIYPTYSNSSMPVNSSYHIALSIDRCAKLEIPIVIGTAPSILHQNNTAILSLQPAPMLQTYQMKELQQYALPCVSYPSFSHWSDFRQHIPLIELGNPSSYIFDHREMQYASVLKIEEID